MVGLSKCQRAAWPALHPHVVLGTACLAHHCCSPPHPPTDRSYWGRPEEQTGTRPAYTWGPGKPASDAAGAAASALAATSLLLRPSDPSYAAACLDHARSLFALASQVGVGCEMVVR